MGDLDLLLGLNLQPEIEACLQAFVSAGLFEGWMSVGHRHMPSRKHFTALLVALKCAYLQVTAAADLTGRVATAARWLVLASHCFPVGPFVARQTVPDDA
jgi:hypothetical protein